MIRDRYQLFRRLRREAPVLRRRGQVLVSRYADVATILSDLRLENGSLDSAGELRPGWRAIELGELSRADADLLLDFYRRRDTGWLSSANGEKHSRLRGLAQKVFTPRAVQQLRDRIQAITDELIERFGTASEVDLVARFSWQLPLIVMCELLDIEPEDRHAIREWAVDIGNLSGGSGLSLAENVRAGHRSLFALRNHLLRVFERNRTRPTGNLMTALLTAETDDGDRFTQDELVFMTAQMVFAGHETTANLIANGVAVLLTDREQWDRLRDDPGLVPSAVEELLRFVTPAQSINRWVPADTEIAGTVIRPGEVVKLLLGSANRDEEQFTEPDSLDVGRTSPVHHLAFGLGPHFCLGAALNRLETSIALTTLIERFPGLRLRDDTIEWAPNWQFLGVAALPVLLDGGHA
jgi:cytochrome P450